MGLPLQFFFFKIPDLVHRRTAAPIAAENRRQMALQTSQQQYDSTLQKSVLCKLSFWFFPGSPKMPLNLSELGLNIIQFISNLYGGVFLQIAGLVSIPGMLEIDCNGNPISTFPPCYAFQMIFTALAPRLIQSISRNVHNKNRALKQL